MLECWNVYETKDEMSIWHTKLKQDGNLSKCCNCRKGGMLNFSFVKLSQIRASVAVSLAEKWQA